MEERNCYLKVSDFNENGYGYYCVTNTCSEIARCFYRKFKIELSQAQKEKIRDSLFESWKNEYNSADIDIPLTVNEANKIKDYYNVTNNNGSYVRVQYYMSEIEPASKNNSISISAKEITSDTDKLKQYIKDLYYLEKEIYCSQQGKRKIIRTINNLGERKRIEKPQIKTMDKIGGKDKYKLNVYNLHLKDEEQRSKEELNLVPQYQEKEKLLNDNIAICKSTLYQLYDLDIIFPKYRNLVAISQIYEYFMTGRCTELGGHEGAYNLFENELRQNIIIMQLNDVLNQLEQIKQNQYMIYQAIQETNARLAQIESNTSAIAYNTSVIAINTEMANRYY